MFLFHTSLSCRFDFLSYFSCYKSNADAKSGITFLEDFIVETAAVGLQRFFVVYNNLSFVYIKSRMFITTYQQSASCE